MLRGYKGWKVKRINGQISLISPTIKQQWVPGENIATCSRCMEVNDSCTCGIYALASPSPELLTYAPDIVGEILMWGSVAKGPVGFRAKRAQVSVLFVPTVNPNIPVETIYELALVYNVELVKAPKLLYDGISRRRKETLKAYGIRFPSDPLPRCRGSYDIGRWLDDNYPLTRSR